MSKEGKHSKKKNKFAITVAVIAIVLVALIGGGYVTAMHYLNKMDKVELNEENLGINKEKAKEANQYGDIQNIALFGVDAPDGEFGRSDEIMIATIDSEHNKLKITSLIRDSYVDIDGHGTDKLNHAYAFGGPELAIKTINQNFDMNIKDFATVNFSSLPKIIDKIGGIDLNITAEELEYINGYISDVNAKTGENSPAIPAPGEQHVNGTQALAYCRIRYTEGGDYKRTERQRTVLEKMFGKFLSMSPTEYPGMLNAILPMIRTNLSATDLLSLAPKVAKMGTTLEQNRFPQDSVSKGEMINSIYYLVFDKAATKEQLHNWIYKDQK